MTSYTYVLRKYNISSFPTADGAYIILYLFTEIDT